MKVGLTAYHTNQYECRDRYNSTERESSREELLPMAAAETWSDTGNKTSWVLVIKFDRYVGNIKVRWSERRNDVGKSYVNMNWKQNFLFSDD